MKKMLLGVVLAIVTLSMVTGFCSVKERRDEIHLKEEELSQVKRDLEINIKKIMNLYETIVWFDKDHPENEIVYYNKDNPGDPELVKANIEKALNGEFEGYMNETIWMINGLAYEYKEIQEDIKNLKR